MEPIGLSPRRAPGTVRGEPVPAPEAEMAAMDPVRLQCAAVAAQQAALALEEAKLVERHAALAKQEEQLAAHLEDKRLELLQLREEVQAGRAALEKERLAFDQHVQRMNGDLAAARRELVNSQQLMEAERRRLEARERALTDKRLRFNAQYELGRCHLREAWQRLRQDQFRWKHRRGQERAALKVRRLDIENAQQKLLEAQRLFIREKRAWDSARAVQHVEVGGLEGRIANQRAKVLEQQNEIARLDATIRAGRQQSAAHPGADSAQPPAHPQPPVALAAASVPGPPLPEQEAWQKRCGELERLAGDLADQRLQLVEHWQRLGHLQARWEDDRELGSRELEELAKRLVDNGRLLSQREQAGVQADQVLRHRHEELVEVRREMIAWRARLRVREGAWEGERQRLLADVRAREELAERHLGALVELRQRWAKCRRQELAKLFEERQTLEAARKEHGRQRLALADQTTSLEAEKRKLADKSLALEQYRAEVLARAESPAAKRRLERLRRRWITLNATAIRAAARERESLKAILLILENRVGELQKRADTIVQAEADLIEKQISWEHKQTLVAARQDRLQHELYSAEAQRKLSEQQVARMKEEIERIARALIDEPDPPTSEALSRAA